MYATEHTSYDRGTTDVLLSQTCWIKVLEMHSRESRTDTTDADSSTSSCHDEISHKTWTLKCYTAPKRDGRILGVTVKELIWCNAQPYRKKGVCNSFLLIILCITLLSYLFLEKLLLTLFLKGWVGSFYRFQHNYLYTGKNNSFLLKFILIF